MSNRPIVIIARRLSDLLGRRLYSNEWGRLGKIINTYGDDLVSEILDDLEEGKLGMSLTSFGLFHQIVKERDEGLLYSVSKIDKVVSENEEASNRAKSLISGLVNAKKEYPSQ